MRNKEFWKSWKNKTKEEKEAIRSIDLAKKIIFENVPKEKIIVIYTGGSFVRRNMNERSDLDTWTIVKDNKTLLKLRVLNEKYKNKLKPEIGFSGYSIQELVAGKNHQNGKKFRPNATRFVKRLKLKFNRIIYGKELNMKKLKINSDLYDLEHLINAFDKLFFPMYSEKKIGFQDLLKQVLLITELELSLQKKKVPNSWEKMAKLTKKGHIIHEALRLRKLNIKDLKVRSEFIEKIKSYLKQFKHQNL